MRLSDWLAQRSFGECVCLLLVFGIVVGWIVGAARGSRW